MLVNLNTDKKDYTLYLVILFFSLMSDIKYPTPIGMLRLFDVLTVLFFFNVIINNNQFTKQKKHNFNFFFLFLIIHVLLSYKIGLNNFIREFIKALIIFSFFFVLIKIKDQINYQLLLNYGYKFSIVLTLWVVIWHLYNGYNAGWKHLQDSRLIFTILPVLHFIYFKIYTDRKFIFTFLTIILFLVILFSGERRALFVFFMLLILFYYKGISIKSIFIFLFSYFIFFVSVNFITNSYVKGYLEKLTTFQNTGNYIYTIETGSILENDSISNIVRAFQLDYSKKLFLENPLTGVGTNGYLDKLAEDYGHLRLFSGTSPLATGLHGEFQRVTVENGLLGIIIYFLAWSQSWVKLRNKINEFQKKKNIDIVRFKFVIYSLYFPALVYISLAGSSLRSFILLGIISVLPSIIESYERLAVKDE